MSAEAIGRYMPDTVTLDDLAAMIAADTYGHRYETSPTVPSPSCRHRTVNTPLW
jgi:hypothetical protein